MDNPVDKAVDKCVWYGLVDKSQFCPQLIHSLSTLLYPLYPQAQFDKAGGLSHHIHISTGPTTTTTNYLNSLKQIEVVKLEAGF